MNEKSINLYYLFLLILLFSTCQSAPKEVADSIWYNGEILTMEGAQPSYVEALAVKGDTILHIGSMNEMNFLKGENTALHDLKGSTLLPGFIEPHIHPLLATILIQTNIIAFNDWSLPHGAFQGVRNEEAYLEKLDSAVAMHSNWSHPMITWGFHNLYHGELDRQFLDSRYGDKPIIIWHYSFHETILNTAAINLLKIDKEQAKVHPQIDLKKGKFSERGNQYLVGPKLLPYILNPQNAIRGMQLTAKAIQKGGITSFADMGMPLLDFELEFSLIKNVLGNVKTPFRTFLIPTATYFSKTPADLSKTFQRMDSLMQYNTDKIQFLKHVKLFADGAFYSKLMQMLEPYTDGHQGQWMTQPEELQKFAEFYWDKDYRIHVHATGDLGVEKTLQTLEHLMAKKAKTNHRFTFHHLGSVEESQVKRIAAMGGQASIQPYYIYALGSKYAQHGLGMERAKRISPVGYLIDHQITTCFHSDFFMAPVEPLTLMWVAVNRKTIDGKTLGAELKISPWQALKAITINAAHHLNQETQIGSLKKGKKADFVILNQNPLKIDPEKINTIDILNTVFEGKVAAE